MCAGLGWVTQPPPGAGNEVMEMKAAGEKAEGGASTLFVMFLFTELWIHW